MLIHLDGMRGNHVPGRRPVISSYPTGRLRWVGLLCLVLYHPPIAMWYHLPWPRELVGQVDAMCAVVLDTGPSSLQAKRILAWPGLLLTAWPRFSDMHEYDRACESQRNEQKDIQ